MRMADSKPSFDPWQDKVRPNRRPVPAILIKDLRLRGARDNAPVKELPMSLANKTLFITDARPGIGLAIALKAARDGSNIVIAAKTDTPHPKLEGTIHSAAEAIEKAGGRS